ncbi:Eukaryotic/viral aspartic protease [Phytophthora megakarya]|uniref:Eukaryotic/viral aspartic protease n=1 Tax=Phytophthora megakarya TaxID=4795 RepID=A0A225W679_9STRA|nr:Eukaryotic/viral aspartic protease [Phytophthora megakarya]
MDPSAGVEVVLGTNLMIPAGVRLDLVHGTARLSARPTDDLMGNMLLAVRQRTYVSHQANGANSDYPVGDHHARRMNCGLGRPNY